MNYKIGDRVICTKAFDGKSEAVGKTGTVIKSDLTGRAGVQFDDYIGGHSCVGNGTRGRCWNFEIEGYLEKVESHHSIHITCTDGMTTHAVKKVDGKIVERSKAVCCPTDEFNANIGAQLAFNRLVYGTDYHPSEVALKPEQPKQEPVKLYCVKDYIPGVWVTKGNVYEIDKCGKIRFDDGYSTVFEDMPKPNSITAPLFPLVSRPAEVGEWVYVTHTDYHDDIKVGGIAKVKRVNAAGSVYISKPDSCHQNGLNYGRSEYLVLDGYTPEPEKAEPEYLNMRVVCVESHDDFTVGKVYEFKNGVVVDDDGDVRPSNGDRRITSLSDAFMQHWSYKFIEFKGE